MEVVRVKLKDRKAKAALRRLQDDGTLEIVAPSSDQDLADLMRLVRKSVAKKLTADEVASECNAVRRDLFEKPRHAASRKAQARR